jgi:hypothetical protein
MECEARKDFLYRNSVGYVLKQGISFGSSTVVMSETTCGVCKIRPSDEYRYKGKIEN